MVTAEPVLMKKLIPLTLLALTATAGAQSLSGVQLGLTGGYASGLSGEIFVLTPNVVGPVGVKVGVATTRAADAINDAAPTGLGGSLATYGDLKKPTSQGGFGYSESGSSTVTSVDATYGLGEVAPGIDATLYGGGRYGMFRATFGDDATYTNYSSNAFGVGAGAMVSYALTGSLSLVGDLGVDHFFAADVNATDKNNNTTTYEAGSQTYAQDTAPFNRPGTNFKARVGIKATF